MVTKVKMLRNVTYPSSEAIRARIRGGDHMPFDERGVIVEVDVGVVVTPPPDLVDSWVANGYAEVVKSKKEDADGSQG